MEKIENFLFYTGMSILFLCLFLTFLFFTPKQINEVENLILIENLTPKEMNNLILDLIEEGDLVLTKPKSLTTSYEYDHQQDSPLGNPLTSFFFYNLFDKIIINSMGDTYWHSGIYTGEGKINSLYFEIREEELDEVFIKNKYLKVLKVKTSDKNRQLALQRAKEHFNNQDIYYSLKNGLLTVYLKSTGSKRDIQIKDDELVCSSYIASIYKEVSFDDKAFTHITPVDLEFSDKTEVKFLINETGFYKKNG